LSVSSSTPSTTANVDVSANASVTFNADIDATTVSATSLALTGPVGAIAANRSTTGATVTLTPQAPLVWGTRYTLAATNALKDKNGQSLGTAFQSSFGTTEPTWQPSTILTTGTNGDPGIAFDGKDNAFAIWQQSSPAADGWAVMTARFLAGTKSWEAPAQLGLLPGHTSFSASTLIAADSQGNALAVWADVSTYSKIYASRYDSVTNLWSAPIAIGPVGLSSKPTAVTFDTFGNAWIVGQSNTALGANSIAFAQRWIASTGAWSPAVSLQYGAVPQSGMNTKAYVDAKGNAFVSWSEANDGKSFFTNVVRFDYASNTWSAPQVLKPSDPAGGSSGAELTIDAAGNVTAVWAMIVNSGPHVLNSSRYDSGTGQWSATQTLLSEGDYYPSNPNLQADAAGNVVLVWMDSDNPKNMYRVSSSRYSAATKTWSPVQVVQALTISPKYYVYMDVPKLSIDAAGNAVATWLVKQIDINAVSSMYSARYSASQGMWSAPVATQSVSTNVNSFASACDRTGSVITLWNGAPGDSYNYTLWATRFSGKP
jgi:hypothetical protein